MMQQLALADGDNVRIESATIPKATFAKLKPMSLDFLNITNPKYVIICSQLIHISFISELSLKSNSESTRV